VALKAPNQGRARQIGQRRRLFGRRWLARPASGCNLAATNGDGNQLAQTKQAPGALGIGDTIAGKLTGPLSIVLAVVAVNSLAYWLGHAMGESDAVTDTNQKAPAAHELALKAQGLAVGLYTVRLVHEGAAEYRKLVVEYGLDY
jgi:hypothetical protein